MATVDTDRAGGGRPMGARTAADLIAIAACIALAVLAQVLLPSLPSYGTRSRGSCGATSSPTS